MKEIDLVIVGAGPAGLSAAISAYENGISNILILERGDTAGGILVQCIHNGFGLHYFKEELTGPEYAYRLKKKVLDYNIDIKLKTMVIDITEDKVITAINEEDGVLQIKAKAVILSMGCRERTLGAIKIPGNRPSGILTAGAAQLFVNIEGYMPGKRVVILGSGDIGLIMARRMRLEGAEVIAVLELMSYSGGLMRNIVQCLEDFNIPLKLSHTVVKVHGKNRLEGVTIARVDENLKPIPETFEYIECDTLLLSVGLIPENELSQKCRVKLDTHTNGPIVNEEMQTNIPGVFACGNVVHVHDLVDFVTLESLRAGRGAAKYIKIEQKDSKIIQTEAGTNVAYTVPQNINLKTDLEKIQIFFRTKKVIKKARVNFIYDGELLKTFKKPILTPGEMESFEINTSDLSKKIDGKILKVEVEQD